MPPVLLVPPILPGFPALRGSDALTITVRLLQAEMPSGKPGVRRALLRPLLPPLDGLRASARLITQENQQGPVRASPEQQSAGIKKSFLTGFCTATGKTSQSFVSCPSIEGVRVSSIARNAFAPLGKYEART